MNKLSKKFITGITVILCLSCIFAILFNTVFLEKYYTYQKRTALSSVCEDFADMIQNGTSIKEAIHKTEISNKTVIVKIDNPGKKDIDQINDEIRVSFQENGIGFQKYWLWEKDYNNIINGEARTRLYSQKNLNYSLLVEYLQLDSSLFIITMIIPNISDAFGIINTFLIGVNVVCIVLSVLFMILLVKRITKPLSDFKLFASNMEHNQFIPLQTKTNDELEITADSLNSMGGRMMEYQNSLREKNEQMKQLLDNVAHDLKTPISLVSLYANGMKDGLDDGTFLNTILEENEQMAQMVNRLLYLSGMENTTYEKTTISLSELFEQLISKYTLMAKENNLKLHSDLEEHIAVNASEELITSLFFNLVTNAIKYCSGSEIFIRLYKEHSQIIFTITNETDNEALDISKIWEPCYVGEKSRNKNLSGTGLGLSIVHKICETQHYFIQCSKKEKDITFTVKIPI